VSFSLTVAERMTEGRGGAKVVPMTMNALLERRRDGYPACPHIAESRQDSLALSVLPYHEGVVSNTRRFGGITAQIGLLRVKIAIVGRNNDGSSSDPP
jgi:hypothetical protein